MRPTRRVVGAGMIKVADAPLRTHVAVASDGSVHMTAFSILPQAGEVWKMQQAPEA